MDTKPLERFASQSRRELLSAVEAQATAVLANGSVARTERAETVTRLEDEIAAHGRAHVIDKVAYTWFNRIIALRFMDAKGYTDAGVVSPAQGQPNGQPEILADAKRGDLNPDVVRNRHVAEAIIGLLDGTRRSTDAEGEAYSLLLTEYCRFWHQSMPFMFEREGDYTELLVPTGLLADGSILSRAREVLTEDVCDDVEVIGWLYQFYISERKQDIFDSKAKRGAEEIPAATQIFTPDWIVRYLVENSVGRLWMLNRPTSRLVDQMEYYITPVDDEPEFLKINTPEELTVIDPACGSGHMLTYAFDLLYAIYEEEGYSPPDIPGLILACNLHGTEIDPRAGALAAFALTMKARGRHRAFLQQKIMPMVCVIGPVSFDQEELDLLGVWTGDHVTEEEFWNQFAQADTLGSLLQPDAILAGRLSHSLDAHRAGVDLFQGDLLGRASQVIAQAGYLTREYAVLVANPPYMGSGNMDDTLSRFAFKNYKTSKHDLFAMFIERGFELVAPRGFVAMVTMEAWMTGALYSKFRDQVIFRQDLRTMVHMPYLGKGRTAMGINFGITAMTMRRESDCRAKAMFQCIRYFELDGEGVPVVFPVQNDRSAVVRLDAFTSIPGKPLIYAASPEDLSALASHPKVEDLLDTREGLTTGDNERFLRRWYEVSVTNVAVPEEVTLRAAESHSRRWYIYVKGGAFRRWYGNFEYVVDWESNGQRVKSNIDEATGRVRSHNYNGDYGFRAGLTWSGMSSSSFSARFVPPGYLFDTKGPMGFAASETELLATLAVLNSGATDRYLSMLAPNLDFKLGHVLNLPVPESIDSREILAGLSREAIGLAKTLWDNSELSLEFMRDPSVGSPSRVEDQILLANRAWQGTSERLAAIRRKIDILLGEDDASGEAGDGAQRPGVAVPSLADRVESLISYSVGCMFGRYSLDVGGLVLGREGSTFDDYLSTVPSPTFRPDVDNVIPSVDDGWFEDDIVDRFRQFLRDAFGAANFEENISFVERTLGVATIRDYFTSKSGRSRFYEDHVQRYSKRPIYWMFSSPDGSFNALVYMQRFNSTTVSTVLNEYLREYRVKLEVALANAEEAAAGEISSKNAKEADRLRKVLAELRDYEHDVLYPLARRQVSIDLDDGVLVNYLRMGRALRDSGLEKERAKVERWTWPINPLEASA